MRAVKDVNLIDFREVMGRQDFVEISPVVHSLRKHPDFVLDLSGENLDHHLFYSKETDRGGSFETNWQECLFYGWHSFFAFLKGNEAIFQESSQPVDRLNWHQSDESLRSLDIPKWSGEGPFNIDLPNDINRIDEDIFFATPGEPLNWGMWLLYALPVAHDFVRNSRSSKLACWALFPWQKNLLEYVGVTADQIVQINDWSCYQANSVRFRTYPRKDLHVPESNRELYLSIAKAASDASGSRSGKRIFISRSKISPPGTPRRLTNETDLANALVDLGFELVEPESMDFSEQISLFYQADVVVGLGGAGMFNCIFCRPGTKIVTIESSAIFIDNHANLFSSLGLQYGVIFGKRDPNDTRSPHHEWSIDCHKAIEEIARFI